MIEPLHPTAPQVAECELLHRIVLDVCGGTVDVLREAGLSDLMARSLVVTVLREAARCVSDLEAAAMAEKATEVVH